MTVIRFFSEPFWQQLGLTLIHFLWQGLLIAVLLAASVRLFRLCPGHPRYRAYLTAFLVMAACPVLTFITLDRPSQNEVAPPPATASSIAAEVGQSPPAADAAVAPTAPVATPPAPATPEPTGNRQETWLSWAVAFWMLGVAILSVRLLLGFVGLWRWRRDLQLLPDEFRGRIARLSQKLNLPQFSRVFISPAVTQATAAGYLRPMVLLPAAMLTQMDPAMIEAVIAHEMAHLRRFDLWVNLAQRIVETLLFYHPAVWWLSNRLRVEREFCCDEMAVAATGERLTYASALETAQRGRLTAGQPALAVALGRGRRSTLSRVRHILGLPPAPPDSRSWLAGAIAVLLIACLTVPTALVLTTEAQEKTTAAPPLAPTAKDKGVATAALFQAIKDTNVEKMRLAIDQGADLEGKNKDEIFLLDNVQSIACTPLYIAAGVPGENADLIRLLLETGANPDTRGPRGEIPLHAAARSWHISVVELLVSAGSDVNATDKEGRTPAMVAFELGHYDMFDLMVGRGATVSTGLMSAYKGNLSRVRTLIENGKAQGRFEQGLTLLHAAAAGGQAAIVDLLLTNGLDVRSKTQEGYTALHYAAAGNHREVAELLLVKGADVNTEPGEVDTPLHWAIRGQHKDMIDWLLARGANPNADGGGYWGTPLHWAVWSEDIETAVILVSHGGDIHLKTQKYPYSPLFDCVIEGNPAMAEALVTKTGDTRAAKWAPLLATAVSGDMQAVEELLAKGADVNAKSDRGLSALHSAAVFGHRDIVELLIEKGADVNAKAERSLWDEGMTALHGSCVKGQKDVAELLIAKGADVNAKSKNGYTPLHIATTEGYRDVVELLIAKGADVNARDYYGRLPLSSAKSRNHTEITELLRKHGARE